MNDRAESFAHIHFCSESLNQALRILEEIKKEPKNRLRFYAFRYAVVEYAKSYTRSDGHQKSYYLSTKYVPVELMQLHDCLIRARHKILAHQDLKEFELEILYSPAGDGSIAGMVANRITGDEEFPKIDEIIRLVKGTLDNLYPYLDSLREGHAP